MLQPCGACIGCLPLPWRATLLSYVHFCSLLHFFFLFCKEEIPYIKKPALTLWEKLQQEKEAGMGCVRETPHVNQHWACKRNSPCNPAREPARGAPCINQHRVCKSKRNSPCNSPQKEWTIMECVRESHHWKETSTGFTSYFLNSSLCSPPSKLFSCSSCHKHFMSFPPVFPSPSVMWLCMRMCVCVCV